MLWLSILLNLPVSLSFCSFHFFFNIIFFFLYYFDHFSFHLDIPIIFVGCTTFRSIPATKYTENVKWQRKDIEEIQFVLLNQLSLVSFFFFILIVLAKQSKSEWGKMSIRCTKSTINKVVTIMALRATENIQRKNEKREYLNCVLSKKKWKRNGMESVQNKLHTNQNKHRTFDELRFVCFFI